MSERYYITGVQLGLIKGLASDKHVCDLVNEIIAEQFIGRMKEPYSDYEIIIRRKKNKRGRKKNEKV